MTWLVLAGLFAASPDVVFVSVDTLRADHLGCYGYELNTSPNIDRFAEDALVFDNCVCEVPLTMPSFGSMMTSRFPRTTGTTRNGLPMPATVPTVAEQFRDAGYQTFCVQSNWTLKRELSGLDRGFEIYEDDFHTRRWGFIKSERYADEVTAIAVELLAARDPDRPLFCWIHYSDPHAPYRFHSAHNPAGDRRLMADAAYKIARKYDSEVAFMDHHIQAVFDAIPQDAMVLFVADHGESLYEHDYLGHGRRIYQTGLHIPLMVRAPGIEPGRTAVPARGVDIGPTLLGLAGLPPAPGMEGVDVVNSALPGDRPRVIETYGGAVPQMPGAEALMADRPPMRQGVLVGPWKLILADQAELFNLDDDPKELTDRACEQRERTAELRALVEAWDAANPRGQAEEAALSEDDIEALESLGYVE
ncbi:MAG: sulfatase [Candidatus Hydrogenedentes bacterium]|nr:sulfatase [Candidatus Hydrogenedentota bacterium]